MLLSTRINVAECQHFGGIHCLSRQVLSLALLYGGTTQNIKSVGFDFSILF